MLRDHPSLTLPLKGRGLRFHLLALLKLSLYESVMKIRPVLLSGGSGTRLWPVSRAKAPKQFVPLMEDENLFVATLRSVKNDALFAPPIIVGNDEHRFLIHDCLDEAKIKPHAVLLEPVGRNTAAAALAAALLDQDSDMLHLVRPSDHVIGDSAAWHKALAQAVPAAQADFITLFGITPHYAETGYGYIVQEANAGFDNVFRIASFKEKPDAAGAAKLIVAGALWNSGIFLYKPRLLIEEARKLAPDLLAQVEQALAQGRKDERGLTLDATIYKNMPSQPFDRVIMEKTQRGAVVPCAMGWNDVGSWQALWQSAEKDDDGNATTGKVTVLDTKDSYIRSEGPAVAVLGMQEVAVIATKDAVLVAPLSRTQDVKALVAEVEKTTPDLAQDHTRQRRPWGDFESLASGPQFQVKLITVLPHRSLSLQMHNHRAEHWIVVAGIAEATRGDEVKTVHPNQSIYIPKGAKHRLSNPGDVDLRLIEVQSGDYLGEDDIIRFADVYGRTK